MTPSKKTSKNFNTPFNNLKSNTFKGKTNSNKTYPNTSSQSLPYKMN